MITSLKPQKKTWHFSTSPHRSTEPIPSQPSHPKHPKHRPTIAWAPALLPELPQGAEVQVLVEVLAVKFHREK